MSQYKRYLWDPNAKVPKTTTSDKQKKKEEAAAQHEQQQDQQENVHQDAAQDVELPNPAQVPFSSSFEDDHNDSDQTPNAMQKGRRRKRKRLQRQNVSPAVSDANELSSSSGSDFESAQVHDQVQQDWPDIFSAESEEDAHEEEAFSVGPESAPKETISPSSKLTFFDVVIMVLAAAIRHSFSWAAQVEILKIINIIFDCDKVPSTKYLYRKLIGHKNPNMSYHIYCSNNKCNSYLGAKENLEEFVTCPCSQITNVNETQCFFVSLSIEDQLRDLFQRDSVVDSLFSHRFSRKKIHKDNFEDIYDGELYQKYFRNNGILSNPHNFSFSFNTDGMPVGKSSTRTLWPIYLTINELPFHDREKYVILAGLYCGEKDPNQSMCLKPFVEQMNKLSSTGFEWTYQNSTVKSLVLPMCAVVDSGARYKLLNLSSYTAHYGCTFCYQKTEHTRRGQRFTVRNEVVAPRTRESTINDCKEAYKLRHRPVKDRVYKGVKGDSALLYLNYFSLISGFAVDYMHCLLQGVISTHMDLLFQSEFKKCWIGMNPLISIKHVIDAIDKRLLNLGVPKVVTRLPRTMHDRAKWKASEWRGWLLLFCIPCVQGILKPKYVTHLSLLCTATNLLLSQSISRENVQRARQLLMRYVFLFQKYFGEQHMVYNLHLLLHIPDQVLNWGPLFAGSCFLYEGQNRLLLKMYHSPNQVVKQLVAKFLTYGSLPFLVHKFNVSKEALEFCEEILNRSLKNVTEVGAVKLVGAATFPTINPGEDSVLEPFSDRYLDFYEKMFLRKCKFTTETYACERKRNSSYVLVAQNKFGQIAKIFTDGKKVYVILKCLQTRNVILADALIAETFLPLQLISFVPTEEYRILPARKIKNVAMVLNSPEGDYITEVPFGCWSGY